MKYLFALCTFLLLFVTASAQLNYKVINIDGRTNKSSNPAYFTGFNGKVYFIAQDEDGAELRVYDGNNVSMVADINPGPNNGTWFRPIFVNNGKLYFAGGTSAEGIELYSYDGTNPPSIVIEIQPGVFSSYPHIIGEHQSIIYLTDSSANTQNLYAFHTQTSQLHKITGTAGNPVLESKKEGIIYNGKIYFKGVDTNGEQLYVFDPADSSLQLAIDASVGISGVTVKNFSVHNNKLYFTAFVQGLGGDIYEYDGTPYPKNLTGVLTPNATGTVNHYQAQTYTYRLGKIYFASDTSLINDTFAVYELDPATSVMKRIVTLGEDMDCNYFTNYNNKLYFNMMGILMHYDFVNPLRKLDTVNGLFKSAFPSNLTVVNNTLFFAAGILPPPNSLFDVELCVIYDSTVGISTIETQRISVVAYPNPTNDDVQLDITLKTPQALSVLLTNTNGQVVYKREAELYSTGTHTTTIPLQELPSGTYIYSVINKDGALLNNGKLMKQ